MPVPWLTGTAAFYRRDKRGTRLRGDHAQTKSYIANGDSTPSRRRALVIKLQRFQTAGRAQHHDRRIFLVFRCRLDLFLGQFERDPGAFVGDLAEMQRVPVDDDLPAADTEKTAEVDHGGTHDTGTINNHIDDASHVLIGRAADIAAEHTMRFLRGDDGDGGWRRRRRRLFGRRFLWWCGGTRLRLILSVRRDRRPSEEAGYQENEPAFAAHVSSPRLE